MSSNDSARTPWTLEDEDNWRKTHHLASKIWFIGGLIMIGLIPKQEKFRMQELPPPQAVLFRKQKRSRNSGLKTAVFQANVF